jgi:hypothetical protein
VSENDDYDDYDHLRATVTDRGFRHMPIVEGRYGGFARVYESSAASRPHLWLNVNRGRRTDDPGAHEDQNVGNVTLHLDARSALALAEQLLYLLRQHYQYDALLETQGRRNGGNGVDEYVDVNAPGLGSRR